MFENPCWPSLSTFRAKPMYFLGSKKELLAQPK